MRHIKSEQIEDKVKELVLEANTVLRPDVYRAIKGLYESEKGPSRKFLKILLENADIAKEKKIAICQDTGMVTAFVDIGRDVVIEGELVADAINKGVERAYEEGFFRSSVVKDPLIRENTGTNTPCDVHIDIISGDKVRISVMPKGFGSENKGAITMMNPTAGSEEIIDFCVEQVRKAGADACPPYVLGIGIGGNMNQCACLAKRALLRPLDKTSTRAHISEMEKTIKEKANRLDIGIMGLGGASTVMGVSIESAPTHIAGLPVAINISCHALRSSSGEV